MLTSILTCPFSCLHQFPSNRNWLMKAITLDLRLESLELTVYQSLPLIFSPFSCILSNILVKCTIKIGMQSVKIKSVCYLQWKKWADIKLKIQCQLNVSDETFLFSKFSRGKAMCFFFLPCGEMSIVSVVARKSMSNCMSVWMWEHSYISLLICLICQRLLLIFGHSAPGDALCYHGNLSVPFPVSLP